MTRLVWIALLSAASALSQRVETSFQFGGTLTQRREITVPVFDRLTEDNGLAGGIVTRIRLVRLGPAAILLEVPIFIVQATNTDLLPLLVRPFFGNTSGVSGFITPGGVVKFLPESRIAPFAFFGGGYARVVEAQLTSVQPLRGGFIDRGTWAINYGGGADLRLFRFLALRGELRNFYTAAPEIGISLPAETRQRNTLLATAGLVFRF